MRKNYPFASKILVIVLSHFWQFIKRLYVFAGFFGIPFGIVLGISKVIPSLFILWGMSFESTKLISKILLTVLPLIPTSIYAMATEEDVNDEFSTDLCFISWIGTIVYAWKFY